MAAVGQGIASFAGTFSPLEQRLFADAADGRLDQLTLLSAALVASGVDRPDALRHYEARYAAVVEQLRRTGQVRGTPGQQAEAVFAFLHQRVLHGGYRLDCTDLRVALDWGVFNCVSASVLFQCLAGEFGLRVRGLEVPTHAMSRLLLPGGAVDVETTCPDWFRLSEDQKKARRANAAYQAAGAEQRSGGVPLVSKSSTVAPAAGPLREVSAVQVIAMIYYNRGVDLLADRRFAEALAVNAKALCLDPSSTTARGNFLATINNWAIDLGASGSYAEAAQLLCRGMAIDPQYATFVLNYEHVHHQWAEQFCRVARFEEAIDVLLDAVRQRPDRPYFRQALSDVYERWARSSGS